MKLLRFILFGLLLSTSIIYARPDFRAGYIVGLNGDTIVGKIDYCGDLSMCSLCRFKSVEDSITEFTPNDITAYRFLDGKYYVSREVDNKIVFLEYLIKGKVNIYYLRDDAGDRYYLDKEDVSLIEIPYERGTKLVNGIEHAFESKKHVGILHYYMQDAPNFESKIKTIIEPDHRNLVKLAEEYHNIVCDGDKCIIYEKSQTFFKVNIEAVTGVVKFKNVEEIRNNLYSQSGILFHIWMPRTNEKIYFKTGFLYSQVDKLDDSKETFLQSISHIAYMAPNTFRIRPSFSIGLFSPSYSAGIALKVSKRINLGIQSWANFSFNKAIFIPRDLKTYALLGSLYIEL